MAPNDVSVRRRTVNGWMVYSLALTALIGLSFAPMPLMADGRKRAIRSTEQVLELAIKRDFEGMAQVASPETVQFMRERDTKWGKIVKYEFEDAVVQVSGTPSWVQYRIWRVRKNVREHFNCNKDRVSFGYVIWPEAETK